jgi:SAM-dependent methyltransferase
LIAPYFYEVARCRQCALGFQTETPAAGLLASIYDRWIAASEQQRLWQDYGLQAYEYLAQQVRFLIEHLGMPPHAIRVFDFGLGWAEWASMAQAFGCQVFGAELSQVRIDNAVRRGIGIVSWDDIPGQQFHYINTEQVFEHLVQPGETIRHLAKALAPGGILKISVPDARSALVQLEKGGGFASLSPDQRMAVHPLEHINSFEYGSIVAMAKRAGLRPLRPSLRRLFNSSAGWMSTRSAMRQAARGIYRHWYPRSTFVYLVRNQA